MLRIYGDALSLYRRRGPSRIGITSRVCVETRTLCLPAEITRVDDNNCWRCIEKITAKNEENIDVIVMLERMSLSSDECVWKDEADLLALARRNSYSAAVHVLYIPGVSCR